MRRFQLPSPRLLCALLAASSAMPAFADLRYTLRYDAAQESMQAELCGAEASDARRFVLDRGAQQFVSELKRSSGAALQADDNVWVARDWHADECLRWRAALGRIADSHAEDVGWRVHAAPGDDDLVVSPQSWLLDTVHEGDAQAELDLPEGYSFSAPWPHDGKSPRQYRIPATPRSWAVNLAIGRFGVSDLRAGEGVLHLAMPGVRDAATQDKLARWIKNVGRAALSGYGSLPQSQVQVLALPTRRGGQAVAFGQSSRGQGHGLLLLIDPTRPLDEFHADWKAVHEFAHLFHPYLGDEGRWLGEGLATYWQNVLRARSGLIGDAKAWDELNDGFTRGRGQTRAGTTLAQASAAMMREQTFLRTNWAGAAYWLQVDVELRRGSAGKLNVDEALRRFRACCLSPAREWSPREFVTRLDSLVGTEVFERRWREAQAQIRFPDLAPDYTALGLIVQPDTTLRFDEAASAANVRHAITSARPSQQ